MRYRDILFDADNTLLDFYRSEREALSDALFEIGVAASDDMIAAYSAINDRMWKKLERGEIDKVRLRLARFEEFARDCGIVTDVPRLAERYTVLLATKSYLMPGALATARTLRERGCRLFIITNGMKSVQTGRFDHSALFPYFEKSFISEEIGAEKPSRAYFDRVKAEIPHFSDRETLVVGDSLSSDIRGGVLAGLDTCWFNPQEKQSPADLPITYTVTRLEEIIPIVCAP